MEVIELPEAIRMPQPPANHLELPRLSNVGCLRQCPVLAGLLPSLVLEALDGRHDLVPPIFLLHVTTTAPCEAKPQVCRHSRWLCAFSVCKGLERRVELTLNLECTNRQAVRTCLMPMGSAEQVLTLAFFGCLSRSPTCQCLPVCHFSHFITCLGPPLS